jgi:hypothetical protein
MKKPVGDEQIAENTLGKSASAPAVLTRAEPAGVLPKAWEAVRPKAPPPPAFKGPPPMPPSYIGRDSNLHVRCNPACASPPPTQLRHVDVLRVRPIPSRVVVPVVHSLTGNPVRVDVRGAIGPLTLIIDISHNFFTVEQAVKNACGVQVRIVKPWRESGHARVLPRCYAYGLLALAVVLFDTRAVDLIFERPP